ncbi:MAG: ABC transporter ATP-binding protein [Methanomicrobiales archaeon]|nr:ABC transporter ATP-binding protein [Methanomicrobiales archaeon]MDI6876055.1 ABC transporter ATP-binding protein [Methanomicrobiales archaeon]
MNELITAREISKVYGEQNILKGVNLTVRKGEILGIIGPSGSGKSTLLRILDLIEPPTSGDLRVFGVNTREEEHRWLELRRRMGMLFQKPIVFNTNVYQNIALGLQYRRLNRAEIERRVKAALDSVGLSQYIKSRARDLSGGEQQRVALSRVLVTQPEILFLDEPTANLDPTSTATIEKIVRRLNREDGMTVVMNTHDMLQGQRLSNRIGVMIGGTLVQTGSPQEIFQTPKSRAIARFVGIENILSGPILSRDGSHTVVEVEGQRILSTSTLPAGATEVDILIRGEDIDVRRQEPAGGSDMNVFSCTITRIESIAPYVRVEVNCGGFPLTVLLTARSAAARELDTDMEAWVSFRADIVHMLPRESGAPG